MKIENPYLLIDIYSSENKLSKVTGRKENFKKGCDKIFHIDKKGILK